jgi:hypothetical protein
MGRERGLHVLPALERIETGRDACMIATGDPPPCVVGWLDCRFETWRSLTGGSSETRSAARTYSFLQCSGVPSSTHTQPMVRPSVQHREPLFGG